MSKKITYQSAIAILIAFAGYFVTYLVNVMIARYLKVDAYGDFSFIVNVVIMASSVLLLGTDQAVLKFIPQYIDGKNWGKVKGYIKCHNLFFFWISLLVIFIGALISALLFLAQKVGYKIPVDARIVFLTAWLIPLFSIATFQAKLLRSFKLLFLPIISSTILPFLLLGIGAFIIIALFNHINIYQALYIFGLGVLLIILLQFCEIKLKTPQEVKTSISDYHPQEWLRLSLKLFVAGLVFLGISNIDLIVLEMMGHNESQVGVFAAILNICSFLLMINLAISIVIAPTLSVLVFKKEPQNLQKFINQYNLLLLVPTIIVSGVIIIFGKAILGIFGETFISGYLSLVAVVISYALSIIFSASFSILRYSEHQTSLVNLNIVTLILTIIIEVLLVPRYGIWGAIIGLITARLMMSIGYSLIVKRWFRIRIFFLA